MQREELERWMTESLGAALVACLSMEHITTLTIKSMQETRFRAKGGWHVWVTVGE